MEEEREGSLSVVHLQKEGSFYHANDWSAWLMMREEILKIGTFNKDMTKFTRRRTMRAGR